MDADAAAWIERSQRTIAATVLDAVGFVMFAVAATSPQRISISVVALVVALRIALGLLSGRYRWANAVIEATRAVNLVAAVRIEDRRALGFVRAVFIAAALVVGLVGRRGSRT